MEPWALCTPEKHIPSLGINISVSPVYYFSLWRLHVLLYSQENKRIKNSKVTDKYQQWWNDTNQNNEIIKGKHEQGDIQSEQKSWISMCWSTCIETCEAFTQWQKKRRERRGQMIKTLWKGDLTEPANHSSVLSVLSGTKLQQSRVQTYHLKQEHGFFKYSRTSRKLTFLTTSTESCFAAWNWWKPLLKAKETPGYWGGFWNPALYSQNGESISLELLPRRSSVTPCRVGR